MNFKSKLVSVVGAGIITLSMVGGVAAQSTADVNVQVNGASNGTLTYSISAGQFGAVNTSFDQAAVSQGSLTLNVTDSRFTRAGWTINISATEFTSDGKPSIAANSLTLTPQNVQTVKGDSSPAPTAQTVTMSNQGQPVMSVGKGSGSGEYKVTLDGKITVPANTQAGTYKTTVTVNSATAPGQ